MRCFRKLLSIICLLIALILSILNGLIAAEKPKSDSASTKINHIDSVSVPDINEQLPWRSSFFVSAGYGYPQGFRGELGYNFGNIVSSGLNFGIFDYWSRDPAEGTLGIALKLFLPFKSISFTPYLLFAAGGTFSISGGSDSYKIFYLGSVFTIKPWLHVRPEIGAVYTSRYIIAYTAIFNGSPSFQYDNKQRVGFNLSFEIDFRQLF
jgi:hypothetical protein